MVSYLILQVISYYEKKTNYTISNLLIILLIINKFVIHARVVIHPLVRQTTFILINNKIVKYLLV
jgi:hypothetical protein